MKKLFYIASTLLFLGGAAHADTGMPPQKAEEVKKYAVPPNTPKCTGDILVDMDGVKLKVPRDTFLSKKTGSQFIEFDLRHPKYDCNLEFIYDVGFAQIKNKEDPVHDLTISVPLTGEPGKLHDAHINNLIRRVKENGTVSVLPSGVEEVIYKEKPYFSDKIYYFFPQSMAPTKNGVPVQFECTDTKESQEKFKNHECIVSYVHPSGLVINYLFYRRDYSVEKYPALEKQRRSWIESMIVAAQNKE